MSKTDEDFSDINSNTICNETSHVSFYIYWILLLTTYLYSVSLAYSIQSRIQPNRKLRMLHAFMHIPLSIYKHLRYYIGACVIAYLLSNYIRADTQAPSVTRPDNQVTIPLDEAVNYNNLTTNSEININTIPTGDSEPEIIDFHSVIVPIIDEVPQNNNFGNPS